MIRERGIPERINRTSLGAMVASGPLGDAIVFMLLLSRVVALHPRPLGSDQWGLGRKILGGRSPRGNGTVRFPMKRRRGLRGSRGARPKFTRPLQPMRVYAHPPPPAA